MKGCDGYILVCDSTNPSSFHDLPKFYKQILECSRAQQALGEPTSRQKANPFLPLVLVTTKADLKGKVCKERMEELAQYRCPIYRTSAKENLNVDQAFLDIFRQIVQKEDRESAKLVDD